MIHPSREIQISKVKGGSFFNLRVISKHPKKDGVRTPHKLSIFVPDEYVDRATEVLVAGKMLDLRHADLDARETDNGAIFASVITSWKNIEILKRYPTVEKQ